MVGLPYPDKRDAELKQKMAYLDEASPSRYVCIRDSFSPCSCREELLDRVAQGALYTPGPKKPASPTHSIASCTSRGTGYRFTRSHSRGRAGREYYSSICMRAVNQSIGRSIRHAGDYASILLVDERYKDD
ncbi:unnamed protein product, partial [Ectocarpus sp. 8 AP-2014]